MPLISKAQGEHCSIVTMYNVISEGWSVGRNPSTKASRSGAGKGTWEPWMSKQRPYDVGRGIVYSLSSPQLLGKDKFADPKAVGWVNTWINQSIAIAKHVGYTPYDGFGQQRGDADWMYGWWDGGKSFSGIPNQKISVCLQCVWDNFKKYEKISSKQGLFANQKDNWNPTDTYLIKKETDKKITAFCDNLMDEVKQAESAPEIYIQSVNDFLIKMVTEGGLVPISLKKQTSEVSISVKENNIHPIPKGKIDVVKGHLVKPKAYAKFDVVDSKGGGKIDFVSNSFKFTAEIQVGTTANRWHIEERMSSKTSSKAEVKDHNWKDQGGFKNADAQAGNVPITKFQSLITKYAKSGTYSNKIGSSGRVLNGNVKYWADLYDSVSSHNFSEMGKVDMGSTTILGNTLSTEDYFEVLSKIDAANNDKALDAVLAMEFNSYAMKKKRNIKKNEFSGKIMNKLRNLRFLEALVNADNDHNLCMILTAIYYQAAKMKMSDDDLQAPFIKLASI